MVKFKSKCKVGEGRWEVFDWLVEVIVECEAGDGIGKGAASWKYIGVVVNGIS